MKKETTKTEFVAMLVKAIPSDTPRTDEAESKPLGCGKCYEFARGLERDLNAARKALKKIAEFDGESIWEDDRDNAANEMLEIAREALQH